MKGYFIAIILLFSVLGCQNPKAELIDQYGKMYSCILNGEDDRLMDLFNAESKLFIQALRNKDNQNEEGLKAVGKEYRVPYFCLKFFVAFSEKRNFRTNEIIQFLINEQVSIFNYSYFYEVINEETKLRGDEAYLAVRYDYDETNRLKWLRFEKEENGSYAWDLLYSLQLHEKVYDVLYKTSTREKMPKEELISYLYSTFSKEERNAEYEARLRSQLQELANKRIIEK